MKKGEVKKGMHLYAKLGHNLPKRSVYIRGVKGSTAHISWSTGRDVVDAHIHIRHLSKTSRKRKKK